MAAKVRIVTADSAELEKTIMVGADAKRVAVAKAPFHSATPGANYRVVIARKRANVGAPAAVPVVKVFHQGGTEADPDTAGSTQDDTPLTAADEAPPAIKGWHGAGFKRGTTEDVVVYTDIKAPTAQPFFKIPNDVDENTPAGDNGGKYDVGATNATVNLDGVATTGYLGAEAYSHIERPLTDEGILDTADDAPVTKHLTAMWKSANFKSADSANSTESDRYTDTIGDNAVKGYFDGVPGTFVCTDTCTIETNHMAAVTGTTGEWVFTPDAGLLAMVDVLDTDYLLFGGWLKTTPKDDGTSSYAFQAFSGGNQPFARSRPSDSSPREDGDGHGQCDVCGRSGRHVREEGA